jgi:hypothetical protein
MSSTSNAQNLLVNVFRPTYTYQAGVGYTPSLVVSNVDKVVTDTVVTSSLIINDPASNVYIGSNAGNSASNVRASSNNVAIGYNAGNGFSNTSNTVALGYNALGGSLSNVSNTVALGANTIGGGVNNILIGHDTGTVGSNNILLGPNQTPGNISNQLRIGSNSNTVISADLSNRYVGINNTDPVVSFDVSGQAYFRNKVGIQVEAPTKSLEVNGETYSSIGFLAGRGSVAKPAYAFYADPSTGLYSPGNGYGSFIANGMPYITFGAGTVNFHGRIVTDISGGGGGTANTITLSNGYVRDTSLGSILTDISEGNIYAIGDTFTNNLIYSGFISNTNTNTSNVIGGVVLSNGDVSANTYNGPGGTANAPHYTFSDDRTTGFFFPGANMIGFTAGGTERVRISNANVGIGTSAPGSALDVSGVVRVIGAAGNITFSNGTINAAVGINISGSSIVASNGAFSNASTTSNSIGGVTLSNTNLTLAGTITGSTANTSNVIGGVVLSNNNVSNSGVITTGTGSNSVGGVTLSNGNISFAGAITGTVTGLSNSIGGVTLQGQEVTAGLVRAGTFTGSSSTTSNLIGGVTLSNFDLSMGGTGRIFGVTNASNRIGGVTLSNTNLTLAGTITGSTANTSNAIGGVILSNNTISNSSTTTSSNFVTPTASSNSVGGVILSNNNMSNSGTTTTSNIVFSGSISNSTTATSNVIGGITLSNVSLGVGSSNFSNYRVTVRGSGGSNGFVTFHNSTNDIPYVGCGYDETTDSFAVRANSGSTDLNQTRMTVQRDTGNVGIGTVSPSANLDVSAAGATIRITDLRPTGFPSLEFVRGNSTTFGGDVNTDWRIRNIVGGNLTFTRADNSAVAAQNGDFVTMTYDGKMGIGTTAPNAALDISGGDPTLVVRNTNTVGASAAIRVVNGTFNDLCGIRLFQSATDQGLYASNQLPMVFIQSAVERMRITPTGNVGIGTASPSNYLHIQKGNYSTPANNTDGTSYGINFGSSNYTDQAKVLAVDRTNSGGIWNGELALYTSYNLGASTEKMRINGVGHVGMGVSNPAYRLDVSAAAAGSASVNMSTWARFSVSNVLIAVASNTLLGGFNGGCWNFSNPIQSMDSNLITFTPSNASVGHSFVIRKSGIWSINFYGLYALNSQYAFLDVSTGNVASNSNGLNGAQVLSFAGQGSGPLSTLQFIGYLPSNSTYIYKIRGSYDLSNLGTLSNRLVITFLGETPDSTAAFPF